MAPKPKGPGGEDPKLQAALKKLQVEPVSGIEEVNMFKEDGNVLHFSAPKGKFSLITQQHHNQDYVQHISSITQSPSPQAHQLTLSEMEGACHA